MFIIQYVDARVPQNRIVLQTDTARTIEQAIDKVRADFANAKRVHGEVTWRILDGRNDRIVESGPEPRLTGARKSGMQPLTVAERRTNSSRRTVDFTGTLLKGGHHLAHGVVKHGRHGELQHTAAHHVVDGELDVAFAGPGDVDKAPGVL